MASKTQIIDKLNEIRATEQRMGMVYRRAAQMVTGPNREALVAEFTEHAADEDSHADYAMSRIMALGGDISTEVPPLPVWSNLQDILNSLDELEEEGIRKWQDLERMLSKDDPFRHTISSIIDREVDHSNDAKKWLRKDFAVKSMGDHGSIKPLNWREPSLGSPTRKSVPWQEQVHSHSQHGTPTTRRGAFHGSMPTFETSLPAELNPPLIMNKAVRTPQKPGASGAQFQRKRDASGKFIEQQQAGVESTAAQDVDDQKRQAELRSAKQQEQMRKPFQEAKAGKEGARRAKQLGLKKAAPSLMSMADSQISAAPQMDTGEVIAQLSDGTPLYSDPFHPSHDQLTPEQHQEAADLHAGMASSAFASGDTDSEGLHQQHADIHTAAAEDNQSPMDRAMGNLAGAPGQGEPPPATGEGEGEDPAQKLQQAFKALNYSYSPDDLDQFTGAPDQNKPSFGQRSEGPAPGMQHTATGGPVGPQTDAMSFNQPPGGTPDAGQAPMDISAQGRQPDVDSGAVPPMDMGQGAPPPPSMDQAMGALAGAPGMGQEPPPPPMGAEQGAPGMGQGAPSPMDMGQGEAPPPMNP
jgi:bacterioferritin